MANGTGVILHGESEFRDALTVHVEAVGVAGRNFVEKGSLLILSEAKKTFRPRPGGQRVSKKTGKTYYSFVPPYQAVPPQPTSRSGALQSSLGKIRKISKTPGGWSAVFGTDLEHANYVEYGTRYMQKEPFMATGIDHSKGKLTSILEAEMAKVVG